MIVCWTCGWRWPTLGISPVLPGDRGMGKDPSTEGSRRMNFPAAGRGAASIVSLRPPPR